MARSFFENFKQANPIYPGSTATADENGVVKLAGGGRRNINLPDDNGGNDADWTERLVVPFVYKEGDTYKNGALYVPYYEADKLVKAAETSEFPEDIDIYGAELGNRSLTLRGAQQLLANANNSNFNLSLAPGQLAKAQTEQGLTGRDPAGLRLSPKNFDSSNIRTFKAGDPAFLRNLRATMWDDNQNDILRGA